MLNNNMMHCQVTQGDKQQAYTSGKAVQVASTRDSNVSLFPERTESHRVAQQPKFQHFASFVSSQIAD